MKTKKNNWLFGLLALLLAAPLLAASSAGSVATLSYLGNTSLPKGMRNNNPGNIRIGASPWKGKIPISKNTDGAFEQFEAYVWGIRAMIINLRSYFNSGQNTLETIIKKWAPAADNNPTALYISTVSQRTGFDPNQTLQFTPPTVKKLVQAMAAVENGREAVTDQEFNYAFNLV